MLVCISAYAVQPPQFGSGYTFTHNGQTLDFYSDGTVYYSANNGAPTRRGDWTVETSRYSKFIGNVTKPVPITVNIYVGDRVVTMKGTIQYCPASGKDIRSLTLDGSTWK